MPYPRARMINPAPMAQKRADAKSQAARPREKRISPPLPLQAILNKTTANPPNRMKTSAVKMARQKGAAKMRATIRPINAASAARSSAMNRAGGEAGSRDWDVSFTIASEHGENTQERREHGDH